MESPEIDIQIMPVTVKLHWPDYQCPQCWQDTIVMADGLYWCASCNEYMVGRTQLIKGMARHA